MTDHNLARAITAWLNVATDTDTAAYQRRQMELATAFDVHPTDVMGWEDGRLPPSARHASILAWLETHS